jgi:hypothetical protein
MGFLVGFSALSEIVDAWNFIAHSNLGILPAVRHDTI